MKSESETLGHRIAASVPARAGTGLKPEHYHDILEGRPDIGWFEVHPENYMGAGGPPHHYLERVRERYPLSLHGVGLSIGGAGPLNREHIARLKALILRYEPGLVSEHLAWSTHDDYYFADLLPLPYTEETLAHIVRHVDQFQTELGRRVLIENPSTYVTFLDTDMTEVDFLTELARRSGCGLLLDVNNVFVSACNHAYDPIAYIDSFPVGDVGEIHLAGFAELADETGASILIDTHDSTVREVVWALYARAIARTGPVPTLIEWDNNIPVWDVLFAEAKRADRAILERRTNDAHAICH